ncbi:hypothetical protein BJ875DRAFT_239136 [Amylocarpus encephaloides]|uniref:Pentacotripeptide-repeat region of PRORP domain-containing protein n=1 Tax=Amylocarpus encephaloides TaxID=45428 RepID=A0A9P7YM35_9HELO|nr:hypothetical protein BJ875DRAFT_239136 [Amylocarpus encephaloides]
MLERTAGCLETGSLRRLLPSSRKSVKSRRTLHSAFWNHAAGDLELPPLWAALVHGEDTRQEQVAQEQRNSASSGVLFLDFLYPVGTLNYIRSFSAWGLERKDGRAKNSLGRLGQRLYTTDNSANDEDIIPNEENAGAKDEAPLLVEDAETNSNDAQLALSQSSFRAEMDSLKENGYDQAWRQYLTLDGAGQNLVRKKILIYFSTSKRIVHAERSIVLFNSLTVFEKDCEAYSCVINAYILLRNLPDAIQLNKEALEKLHIPVGSAILFTHFVDHGHWTRACILWWEHEIWLKDNAGASNNILKGIQERTNFIELICSLVTFANIRFENSAFDSQFPRPILLVFATNLARMAFDVIFPDQFDKGQFLTLFRHLQRWSTIPPLEFEEIFRCLLSLGQKWLAIQIYRKIRQGQDFKFTRKTLHMLMRNFSFEHNIQGIQDVLDDFYRCYTKPSRLAYKWAMTELASRGDVETVRRLFDGYMLHYTSPERPMDDPGYLSSILQAHSKRGEVSEVIKVFDSITEQYGLQPNVMCWNILIASYCRLQDFDGAFGCFEAMTAQAGLTPSAYTFGTLMGIASERGDLEAVQILYRKAQSSKIQMTSPMVDCLVKVLLDNDDFPAAEDFCEKALEMPLKGSRTRMWNYLIVACGLHRDLESANRIVQRMSQAGVLQDEYTYAALMQTLAMVSQPTQAAAIMNEVLPRAGYEPSAFHYAVMMGAYLARGMIPKVFRMYDQYSKRKFLQPTASTNSLLIRAQVDRDSWLLQNGEEKDQIGRAVDMLLQTAFDPQDMADNARKTIPSNPLDIAYPTSLYGFVMYSLAQQGDFDAVTHLYERYKTLVPSNRHDTPPIQIISALLMTKYQMGDVKGVQQCWDLALSNSSTLQRSISPLAQSSENGVGSMTIRPSHKHQLNFAKCLSMYLRSLSWGGNHDQMIRIVDSLLQQGFVLDNHNWNTYVECLLSGKARVKTAFLVFEEKLMPKWTGWAKIRKAMPGVKSRLPMHIRNARKDARHLRPLTTTALAIAREHMRTKELAVESQASQYLLEDIERLCPKTLYLIQTMPFTDDMGELDMLEN